MSIILETKHSGETKTYSFSFISLLAAAETISTASVAATVYSGTDASPSAIVSGSSTISGQTVTQSITAGVVGVTYLLACTITTNLGQTLQLEGFLTVVPGQY